MGGLVGSGVLAALLFVGLPPLHNDWGAQGALHMEAPNSEQDWAVNVWTRGRFSTATNVFLPGDQYIVASDFFGATATFMPGLEAGLEAAVLSSWYTVLGTLSRTYIGNPTLHVKYGRDLTTQLSLGASARVRVPTSLHSSGLVPQAAVSELRLLGCYAGLPGLRALTNLGFVLDRSSVLAAPASLSAERRFVYQVNGSNAVTWGLAVDYVVPLEVVNSSVFVEYQGAAYLGVPFSQSPQDVSAGVKAAFLRRDLLEFAVAYTQRLSGAPTSGGKLSGEMPWQLSLQATVHLSPELPTVLAPPGPPSCQEGEMLQGGLCVKPPASATTPTVVLRGRVLGKRGDKGLNRAQLQVGNAPNPLLAQAGTGAFSTSPFALCEGLLQVRATAPGYKESTVTLPCSLGKLSEELVFRLDADGVEGARWVRGSVLDARTGNPVSRARVGQGGKRTPVAVDALGHFSLVLTEASLSLQVVAPGYRTQFFRLTVGEGDTFILNIDLQRR